MTTLTKITSPTKGVNTSGEFGGVRLEFVDGVAATTREINPGLRRYLERRGYTVTTEGQDDGRQDEGTQDEGTQPPTPDAFDPADHGVDEVLGYLETASDEEAARVREAERTGKGRKTIIGGEAE